jgi:hypothetical protein
LLLALVVSVPTLVATAVIQVQVTAANVARTELGLRLLGDRAESLLGAANQGIGIAMMLVPAAVFAVAYLRFRTDARARTCEGRDGLRELVAVAAAEVALLAGLVAIGATPVDPRPGLVRVIDRNPDSPRAYLALASHDALAGLGKRSATQRSRAVRAD